ncbi:MAG: phosphate ABC transporter substrate-binding protein [Thermoguttaceae bacterium]
MYFRRWTGLGLVLGLSAVWLGGCNRPGQTGGEPAKKVIRVAGSDTMVNIAQAWAERYGKLHPDVSVQVRGGGSGVGIAAMIDGNCDMANASRQMEAKEIEQAKAKRGAEPKETVVGYDALALYVHKDNPLDSISTDELAEIYKAGGTIERWSQLGLKEPPGGKDEIVRVSRQNSSGTYAYFREVVLNKQDYKLGTLDQSGSKDVVALVARTPSAIGYSGMGYATPEVKMLKVSKHKGEAGVAPTVENAKKGTYPITRSLQIYTVGEPTGRVKAYLDWILSAEGQKILLDQGYVSLSSGPPPKP